MLTLATFVATLSHAEEPSVSTLTASAINVLTPGTPLLLSISNKFNRKPETDCTVRLYGKLSYTNGADTKPASRFRIASKSAFKKKTLFTYRGPAIRLSQGLQTQLNLQTATTCPGSNGVFYSNAVAVNVTCTKGLSSRDFAEQLQSKTRKVYALRNTARSGSCQ